MKRVNIFERGAIIGHWRNGATIHEIWEAMHNIQKFQIEDIIQKYIKKIKVKTNSDVSG